MRTVDSFFAVCASTDLDLLAEILGLGPSRGDAHSDRFACEAYLVVRERVPLGQFVARHGRRCDDRCDIAQIGADENLVFRAGRFDDAPNAAMRDRAAQKGNFALPGEDHIRHEVAATAAKSRSVAGRLSWRYRGCADMAKR